MSTHLLGFPALSFFLVLGFVVFRSGRVSWLDVFIFMCIGYYLGGSLAGTLLNDVVFTVGGLVGGGK